MSESMKASVVSLLNNDQAAARGLFKYEKDFTVTFGLTNAEKNMTHEEYPRMFGVVRELFAIDFIPNFVADVGRLYLFKTQSAEYIYLKDYFFGDVILVSLYVRNLSGASFTLEADFINRVTGETHARASQQIVFTDMNGVPRRLPREIHLLLESMISQ